MIDRVGPTEDQILAQLMTSARNNGVGDNLPILQRMLKQGSQFDQSAVSHKGAVGLMQLKPSTAKEVGVDPSDWRQNIEGGVRYWAQMKREFVTPEKTAAAYNGGGKYVREYGGVPRFRETRHYVDVVTGQPRDWDVYDRNLEAQKAMDRLTGGPEGRAERQSGPLAGVVEAIYSGRNPAASYPESPGAARFSPPVKDPPERLRLSPGPFSAPFGIRGR